MAIQKLGFLLTANTKQFSSAIKAAGLLVAATFVAAIKVTADYNKELSKLKGISGATGSDMKKLAGQARGLGASTTFTAVEVVKLQVELAKLGFTTSEILNSSGGVLDLAAGLGVSLADAAVLTGSTLRAFGLDTKKTRPVVDVLAKSATSSALDFNKLTESLKLVAPVAAQLGYSLEDTTALLGTMADAGIHGSQAGTGLRQIFLQLIKEGITLEQAFERVNSSSLQTVTAMDLVKKRALPAFLVLKEGTANTKKLKTAFDDAAGAADKLRREMENNTWGDWKKLLSAITDVGISLGEAIDGPLRKAIQGLTKWISEGGLLRVLDAMYKVFIKVSIAVVEFGRAIDFVALAIQKGPFGTGFVGDSAIAKRIVAATKLLEDFRKKLKEINEGKAGFEASSGGGPKPKGDDDLVPSLGGDLDEVVVGAPKLTEFEKFVRRFRSLAEGLDEFLNNWFAEGAVAIFTESFAAMGRAIGEGGNILSAAGSAIVGVLGTFISSIGQFILDLALEAIKLGTITVVFAKAIAAIKAFIIANPIAAIAGGLALIAIGAAFSAAASKSAASISGGGGGASANPGSNISNPATPSSLQGAGGGGMQLVATVRGQDLRYVLQAADDSYSGLN